MQKSAESVHLSAEICRMGTFLQKFKISAEILNLQKGVPSADFCRNLQKVCTFLQSSAERGTPSADFCKFLQIYAEICRGTALCRFLQKGYTFSAEGWPHPRI
jgi:hypothetical protein